MIIFSPVQVINNNLIVIPSYIQSALGLHDKLNLHISIFDKSDQKGMSEIVISHIPFPIRSDLWILKTSFRSRPGLMFELSNLLRRLNIDIVRCYKVALENYKYANIEMLLDCQLYESFFDYDSIKRRQSPSVSLSSLEAKITAHFIEDILFYSSGEPYISIKRNIPTYRSIKRLAHREESRLSNSAVTISDKAILVIAEQHFGEISTEIMEYNNLKNPYTMLYGDMDDHLIRCHIFFKNIGFTPLKIKCINKVGTLAAISNLFSKRGFLIHQLFQRNIDGGNHLVADVLVRLLPEIDKQNNDDMLRKYILNMFSEDPDIKEYEPEITFPDNNL